MISLPTRSDLRAAARVLAWLMATETDPELIAALRAVWSRMLVREGEARGT